MEELVRRKIETYVIDDFSTGSIENIQNSRDLVHILRGDLTYAVNLLPKEAKIDVVFHEAAIASVPRSVSEPYFVHEVNVSKSISLMDFCTRKKIRRFVFASSAAVYGILGRQSAVESYMCKPASPYGAGKLAVENYLHAYARTFGLEPVILRYFNIFGPRQRMNDYSGVITIFAERMLAGLPVVILGDGKQTRDFVHVKDIVQANMLAMESDKAVGEIFNVATGSPSTILDLYDKMKGLIGRDIKLEFASPRPGDVKDGNASIDKIRHVLGYRPRTSLGAGLSELIQYMGELEKSIPSMAWHA